MEVTLIPMRQLLLLKQSAYLLTVGCLLSGVNCLRLAAEKAKRLKEKADNREEYRRALSAQVRRRRRNVVFYFAFLK